VGLKDKIRGETRKKVRENRSQGQNPRKETAKSPREQVSRTKPGEGDSKKSERAGLKDKIRGRRQQKVLESRSQGQNPR
jgi:hypothetical protein